MSGTPHACERHAGGRWRRRDPAESLVHPSGTRGVGHHAGRPWFYDVTKYLHHVLHDRAGAQRFDRPELMDTYGGPWPPRHPGSPRTDRRGCRGSPRPAGPRPDRALKASGARVVWHCHIGTDTVGAPSRQRSGMPSPASWPRSTITTNAALPAGAPASAILVLPQRSTGPKNRDLAAGQVQDLLEHCRANAGATRGRTRRERGREQVRRGGH